MKISAKRRVAIREKVAELREIQDTAYADGDYYVGGMVDAADLDAALDLVEELLK